MLMLSFMLARLFRLRLSFLHIDHVPGLGIDVNLHHLVLRHEDFDFPDQLVVLLFQLGPITFPATFSDAVVIACSIVTLAAAAIFVFPCFSYPSA